MINRIYLLFFFFAASCLSFAGCSGGGDGTGRTVGGTGFVYVANSGAAPNTISMFRVTSGTGELGSVGTPVAAGTQPQQVVLDTTGRFAFAANAGSGNLSSYLVDVSGALLSLGAAISVGTTPRSPTIDPLNRYLFVPNSGSDNISVFALNVSTGALTSVANSPFPTGSNPQAVSLDSQGRFVWVNNQTAGTVSMFFVNTGGVLTPALGGGTVSTGSSPQRVTFLSLGLKLFAYVANVGSGTISAFEVNQTTGGVANSVSGSPFPAGTSPSTVVIDPTGRFALVANTGSSDVSVYTIDPSTGALTVVQNPGPPLSNFFAAGTNPQVVTIHPTGNFVYVSNTTVGTTAGSVSAYTINQFSGVLTLVPGSPFTTGGAQPQRVTVDPTGKFAFVSNQNSDTISVFSINQMTGALTPVVGSPFATGDAPEQATTAGTF